MSKSEIKVKGHFKALGRIIGNIFETIHATYEPNHYKKRRNTFILFHWKGNLALTTGMGTGGGGGQFRTQISQTITTYHKTTNRTRIVFTSGTFFENVLQTPSTSLHIYRK